MSATFKPLKSENLDVANIRFAPLKTSTHGYKSVWLNYNDSPIRIQTPELEIPYDSGNFYPQDKNPTSGKYTIKVSLKGEEANIFREKMIAMDEILKKAGIENSVSWFKKKTMTMDAIDNIYTPMVKSSCDKETGEPDGKYPDTFQFKILQYDNVVKCGCFDADKQPMNVSEPDKENHIVLGIHIPWSESATTPHVGIFKKGTQVKAVLRCKGIWITNGNFGCGWEAEQIRIKPQPTFDDYAFLDDSEGEEEERGTIEGNFVNSSSDESDEEEERLSRQVSKK